MVGDGFGGRLWYTPTNYEVGPYTAFAICGDNRQLISWGANYGGVMGDTRLSQYGTSSSNSVPNMHSVKQMSVGYVTGAIKFDHSGWVWGEILSENPIKVLDDVHAVDAGKTNVVFVKKDGTVWQVGSNKDGRFGTGDRKEADSIIPVKMTGIHNAARAVDGGLGTFILLSDSTVMVSGCGLSSDLNTDTIYPECLPRFINNAVDIVDIKANNNNMIALNKQGGVSQYVSSANYMTGVGGLQHIVAISGSYDGEHFLALDKDGNCYAWGRNRFGQLGNGEIASDFTSEAATLVHTDVVDILAGETFSYIVKSNGNILAAGSSYYGYGSIWMNLPNLPRYTFTKLNPGEKTPYLCNPKIIKWKELQDTMCQGDTLMIGDKSITESGNYIDIIPSIHSTDSVLSYWVHFKEKSETNIDTTLCYGETFKLNNRLLIHEGYYTETITNTKGCDSTININLKFRPPSYSISDVQICYGTTYKLGEKTYSEPGTYIDTSTNALGCDSLTQINLIVLPPKGLEISATLCHGDSLTLADKVYYYSGEYTDTLLGHSGCDSIITLSLDVLTENIHFQNRTICSGDSIYFGSNFRFLPETYTDTLTSKAGCDSITVLSLDTFTDYTCYEPTIHIPNTFTPNKNPLNNFFRPIGINITHVHLMIFSKWGELLYDVEGPDVSWDGNYMNKPCQQGVYVYLARVSTTNNEVTNLSGTVTLLR